MALTIPAVKLELKELREQRESLERKIRALEDFLGVSNKGSSNGSGVVVRGGVDITPTVEAVFAENGNRPIRKKELTDMVAGRHPELDKRVVESKMINVTRKRLESPAYGMYRLKLPG